jgi:DNA repair photolyase
VIRTLAEAGIPVSVSIAPVIPFVTEPDLERVMEAAVEAGARQAATSCCACHGRSARCSAVAAGAFPDRAARVMNRIQDMRGGKDYDADFATRMRGTGVWADLLHQRFEKASRRLGIDHRNRAFATLDASRFRRPVVVPAGQGGRWAIPSSICSEGTAGGW